MKIYTMSLHDDPFIRIASWEKTMEYRLFDEKRKDIKIWDKIQFTNRDFWNTCMTQVVWLVHYPTFDELFADIQSCLKDDSIWLYYTIEEQKKHWVLGIKIVKL